MTAMVWIVIGSHPVVPGDRVSAHSTDVGAAVRCLELEKLGAKVEIIEVELES